MAAITYVIHVKKTSGEKKGEERIFFSEERFTSLQDVAEKGENEVIGFHGIKLSEASMNSLHSLLASDRAAGNSALEDLLCEVFQEARRVEKEVGRP